MTRALLNLVLFQVAWWSCILGAAHGRPLLGPAVAAGAIAIHLALARQRGAEAWLIAWTGMCGWLADSVLAACGVIRFDPYAATLAPLWMLALWCAFATTLNGVLAPLQTRLAAAAVVGAVSGPAAYYAGAALGALELPAPPAVAVTAIAIEWGIMLPILLYSVATLRRPLRLPAARRA